MLSDIGISDILTLVTRSVKIDIFIIIHNYGLGKGSFHLGQLTAQLGLGQLLSATDQFELSGCQIVQNMSVAVMQSYQQLFER